jgi:hypothetical protein
VTSSGLPHSINHINWAHKAEDNNEIVYRMEDYRLPKQLLNYYPKGR